MKVEIFLVAMLIVLCSCQGRQVQNPPVQIDTERQARIEKAMKELKSEDAEVRSAAVRALGELGAKEYVKDIAELLKDKDADVRWRAALALGLLGAKEYAKDIAKLLKDENADAQAKAEWVLKECGVDVEKLKSQNAK